VFYETYLACTKHNAHVIRTATSQSLRRKFYKATKTFVNNWSKCFFTNISFNYKRTNNNFIKRELRKHVQVTE